MRASSKSIFVTHEPCPTSEPSSASSNSRQVKPMQGLPRNTNATPRFGSTLRAPIGNGRASSQRPGCGSGPCLTHVPRFRLAKQRHPEDQAARCLGRQPAGGLPGPEPRDPRSVDTRPAARSACPALPSSRPASDLPESRQGSVPPFDCEALHASRQCETLSGCAGESGRSAETPRLRRAQGHHPRGRCRAALPCVLSRCSWASRSCPCRTTSVGRHGSAGGCPCRHRLHQEKRPWWPARPLPSRTGSLGTSWSEPSLRGDFEVMNLPCRRRCRLVTEDGGTEPSFDNDHPLPPFRHEPHLSVARTQACRGSDRKMAESKSGVTQAETTNRHEVRRAEGKFSQEGMHIPAAPWSAPPRQPSNAMPMEVVAPLRPFGLPGAID